MNRLLVALVIVLPGAMGIPNPGLENKGEGWWFEPGRSGLNRVEWATEGAYKGRTCAKLIYSGKEWLWLNSPPLLELEPKKEVTLAFHVQWLSGGNTLAVGCNSLNRSDKSWGAAYDNLWVGALPKDNLWHELEIQFITPEFDFKKRYACIKIGPPLGSDPTTLLVDDVRILSVAERKQGAGELAGVAGAESSKPQVAGSAGASKTQPRPPGESLKFDLPDQLLLDHLPHVSEVTRDGKLCRAVRVGNVHVRAPSPVAAKMGFQETLPLVIENKGEAQAVVEVVPVERMNVSVRRQSTQVAGGGKAEVPLEIQTLRAVDFDLVLRVRASGAERLLPIRIEPQATYPVFGLVEHFMRSPPRTKWDSFQDPEANEPAEEDMKYMRFLPCQVFRVDGPGCWSIVEPNKGEYFFDAADWHVDATRKFGGSRSVMLLGYEPRWAQPFFDPRETEKLDHWRDYVRAVVRRYRDKVDYWEIWNEPYGFWFGAWGKFGRKRLFQKDYAEECSPILGAVIKIASEVIRQEDPHGRILTPGFVPEVKKAGSDPYRMMDKLFQMGMGDWVDFINLHIYPLGFQPAPVGPSQWKVDGKDVVSWDQTLNRWREFDRDISMRDLLALMRKHGVEKPIWITEFGGHPAQFERFQGLGILREAAVLVSEGARGLHYYEFYDYPHERSRLQLVRHEDKYRTLGLVAYREAIRHLTGASYEPERCDVRCLDETTQEYLPFRVFGRGEETIICLWSNAPKPVGIEIRTKKTFASAQVSNFSPDATFLTQTSLSVGQKSDDGATEIVSDRQLLTRLETLQFRMISFAGKVEDGRLTK